MKVTAQVRKLYSVLSCIPPDFEMAETLIAMHRPSEEEMMWLAVELAENTFGEYGDKLAGKKSRSGRNCEILLISFAIMSSASLNVLIVPVILPYT